MTEENNDLEDLLMSDEELEHEIEVKIAEALDGKMKIDCKRKNIYVLGKYHRLGNNKPISTLQLIAFLLAQKAMHKVDSYITDRISARDISNFADVPKENVEERLQLLEQSKNFVKEDKEGYYIEDSDVLLAAGHILED